MDEMIIRSAAGADMDEILRIMDGARTFQRQCGFRQWDDGYPDRNVIAGDMDAGNAYVFICGGLTAGYVCLAEGDAEYDRLADTWECRGRYGVVHRLAMAPEFRGKGLGDAMFRLIEEVFINRGIDIVRADTGKENQVMQRVLDRNGYIRRGYRLFVWGWRYAYEKCLH